MGSSTGGKNNSSASLRIGKIGGKIRLCMPLHGVLVRDDAVYKSVTLHICGELSLILILGDEKLGPTYYFALLNAIFVCNRVKYT